MAVLHRQIWTPRPGPIFFISRQVLGKFGSSRLSLPLDNPGSATEPLKLCGYYFADVAGVVQIVNDGLVELNINGTWGFICMDDTPSCCGPDVPITTAETNVSVHAQITVR